MMGTLLQDLRYGVRMLLRTPGFTAISVLTLALGIGATSVMFSFISGVLSSASPVADMDRRAVIWSHNRAQGETKNVVSPEDFEEWRRRQTSFDRFSAQQEGAVNLSGTAEPVRASAQFVTSDFFDVFGQQPLLGRAFQPDEEQPGAARVVILSNRFWREHFGGTPDVLGREIQIDARPATVVGVLPENDFARNLILPLAIDPLSPTYREHSLFVMARLREGAGLEQARAEMAGIGEQLERERPDSHRGWGVNTRPLQEEFVGPQARLAFAMLAAAAAAVLLIGCANIANLLLARGIGRAREVAVRTALGASRGRLVRQMLAESFVLALAGVAGGLLLTNWGLEALRNQFAGFGLSTIERWTIDLRVLAFAAIAGVIATLAFGLLPALQSVRADVNQALRDGTRSTGGIRTRRLRSLLVGTEVATAVLFLVVALLMIRTLDALQRIEPGFDAQNVLTMKVSLPEARYPTDASVVAFHQRLVDRLRAANGIDEAGAGARVPAAGSRYNPNRSVVIQGRPATGEETLFAADLTVTPGYLETLRIPLRAGRALDGRDGASAPLAVVVSETMVRRYWNGSHDRALGARLRLGDEPSADAWRVVVGVVGDVRNDDIDAPPLPMVYVPLAQRTTREMTIVMRTAADPVSQAGNARAAVTALDPEQPVYQVKSMMQIVEEDLRQSVVLIAILGIFATLALALAALGIYGVVAHAVAQRTHEIGVRMALGAAIGDVMGLVVRQGFTPVAGGLIAGLAAGLGVSRLMRSILYGITPSDPVTYGAVVLVLAVVALVACAAPARRAARVDPLTAIRAE
jgi:putative ABC transport system permease protein